MEAEIEPAYLTSIRDADMRAFSLTWEDCEQLLAKLGYSAQVSIIAR